MEPTFTDPTKQQSGETVKHYGSSTLLAFVTVFLVHSLFAYLFYLCINPIFHVFNGPKLDFLTTWGLWTGWMMLICVPLVVSLSYVKYAMKSNTPQIMYLMAPPLPPKNDVKDYPKTPDELQ